MKKTSIRKFFLFGHYSLAILPPKKWLTEFNVKEGDCRVIELDRKKQRLIIHLKEVEMQDDDNHAEPEATKKDDWQPIPPLG